MKRISVRRKRKAPEPKPEPEPAPKPQEEEPDAEFSSSESLPETEPPVAEFQNLKMDDRPKERPRVRFEPQDPIPRSATPARPHAHVASIRRDPGYVPTRRPQYIHDPRSDPYGNSSRRRQQRPNLHYQSPYGPGTWGMSTQEKTHRLYSSCFG